MPIVAKLYACDATKIKTALEEHFPHVDVEFSTLGGEERASIIIKVSLDPKDTWINNIFHNSRYSMFHFGSDNKVEQFGKHYQLSKFRKANVKNLDQVIEKIKQWADKQ